MTDWNLLRACASGGAEFVDRWRQSCNEGEQRESRWVAGLRSMGIKAAHPDDGWVDREKNSVNFCYPQFNDGVKEGDQIALGWPERWRVVTVREIKHRCLSGEHYMFST